MISIGLFWQHFDVLASFSLQGQVCAMSSRRSVAIAVVVCVWVKGRRGECEREEVSVREVEEKICFMMFFLSRDENYEKLYSSQAMYITLPNIIVQSQLVYFLLCALY